MLAVILGVKQGNNRMSSADTARKTYEAARQEILLRMQLRDQALLVYLTVVGAILGVSFGGSGEIQILMSIPYMALGISILVSQHNVLLVFLGKFCTEEITDFLKTKRGNFEYAPDWDGSKTFKLYAYQSTWFRLLSHCLIVFIPCLLSLGLNWKHIFSPFPEGIIWWFGALCSLIALSVILYAHVKRQNVYRERCWNNYSTEAQKEK